MAAPAPAPHPETIDVSRPAGLSPEAAVDSTGATVGLELEHALGFTQSPQGLAVHPNPSSSDGCTVAYGCGKLLVLSDVTDPHGQRLLRGHDATITAVDFGPGGAALAAGQEQAVDGRVYVCLWDVAQGAMVSRICTPHRERIEALKLSPDGALLASTGGEGSVCVWDSRTGERVAHYADTIAGVQAKAVAWGAVVNPGTRSQRYSFAAALSSGVRLCRLSFSVKSLQYELQVDPVALPGGGGRQGGFQRRYLAAAVLGDDLLCGTATGDIVVCAADTGVFRAALNVAGNGVTAICAAPAYECCVVAGGDGSVRRVVGSGKEWSVAGTVQLDGAVCAMSLSADGHQVIAMTTAGHIYRLLTGDLATMNVAVQAPLGGLTDTALPLGPAAAAHPTDVMASASLDGLVRLWSLSDYRVLSRFTLNATPTQPITGPGGVGVTAQVHPTSVAFDVEPGVLVSGWSDGHVRCLDTSAPTAAVRWVLQAHNGAVHTVRVTPTYYMTGGSSDSTMRVWSRRREPIAQVQDHQRPTTTCLVDNTTDGLVHTLGHDMAVLSYDLSKREAALEKAHQPRRVSQHIHTGVGAFLCGTQRRDGEHELIVGTAEGAVLFFDLDYATPTLTLRDRAKAKVLALDVSPCGRYLAVGMSDGALAIYALTDPDAAPGKAAAALLLHAPCHSAAVVRCTFTADGRQLVSSGGDGELVVWNFYKA